MVDLTQEQREIIWKKARKKPVVIEFREVEPTAYGYEYSLTHPSVEEIETKEGVLVAVKGQDFVIRGVEGELYPISKGIFEKTYERVEGEGLSPKIDLTLAAVLALLDAKIAKIQRQRVEEDYSTLQKGQKDCPEGCGDEGLFHQVQILLEFRGQIEEMKEK